MAKTLQLEKEVHTKDQICFFECKTAQLHNKRGTFAAFNGTSLHSSSVMLLMQSIEIETDTKCATTAKPQEIITLH